MTTHDDFVIECGAVRLTGGGDDIPGPFTRMGHVQNNAIVIRKRYHGQHAIDYHGVSVGEGIYCGDWSYSGDVVGKWSIHMRSLADGVDFGITEIK